MHPYRIIVTNGGGRVAVISLCRVFRDAMPTRQRDPSVEQVLFSCKVALPKNQRTGLCNPPRPEGLPKSIFDRELMKVYELYDTLVAAPTEKEHEFQE